MLESLTKGNGNIQELNLEGVFTKPKLYQPIKLYELLKKSALYDKERGHWNECMTEMQERKGRYRYGHDQLLGILVEIPFNFQNARQRYEELKASPFYNTECGQWNHYVNEKLNSLDSSCYSYDQLLGVLVEAQFNSAAARKVYKTLKQPPLHDTRCGQWNNWVDENQTLVNSSRYANIQLLAVLVEAQFNPNAAYKSYESLKHTPLYDIEDEQWNCYMNINQELVVPDRHANAQLLGVLVEMQFNPEAARMKYEALKLTRLYNAGCRQWNQYVNEEKGLVELSRYAHDQLLAILVEAKLLSLLSHSTARTIPPLPIITEI